MIQIDLRNDGNSRIEQRQKEMGLTQLIGWTAFKTLINYNNDISMVAYHLII